jgi:hypothetical protein
LGSIQVAGEHPPLGGTHPLDAAGTLERGDRVAAEHQVDAPVPMDAGQHRAHLGTEDVRFVSIAARSLWPRPPAARPQSH